MTAVINRYILKITNIKWDLKENIYDNLPKEIELKWGNKKWNKNQVINWLSNHFNCKIDNCNIQKLKIKDDSG